jgi:hypothetical protein
MRSRLISMPAPDGVDLCDVEGGDDEDMGNSRGGESYDGAAKGSPMELVLKCRGENNFYLPV